MAKKKKVAVARRKPVKLKAKANAPRRSRAKERRPAAASAPTLTPPKIRIPKKHQPLYHALVNLRERITRQISFLATDNLQRNPDDAEVNFRSEEQGTDNFDRDFALNRVSMGQDILLEIDEALNRIQMGSYGICEDCGRAIEQARMDALPYSRMCVRCQSKSESGRRYQRSLDSGEIFPNQDKALADSGADVY
ncbi:MAG: TraR/DksA family transcriptional regulator [Lentisphaerae bacterium]|nr:TraR/DksA family transcriptional regulator [Lentisphaerota bacterium]